jgi:hypothetical protein
MPNANYTIEKCLMCGKPNSKITKRFLGIPYKKDEFGFACKDCEEASAKEDELFQEAKRKKWLEKRKHLIGR